MLQRPDCFVLPLALLIALSCTALFSAPGPADTNEVVTPLGGGWYRCGAIRFNRDAIHFPAQINMTNGLLEYAAVSAGGKLHESLLRTDIEPYQLHLAVLFTTPTNAASAERSQPAQFDLKVQVRAGNRTNTIPLESWVRNKATKRPMEPGPWIYTGSRVIEGEFIAQRDRSLVAIYDDPDALLNHARAGHDDDEIWYAREEAVPPEGTRVEVVLERVKNRE